MILHIKNKIEYIDREGNIFVNIGGVGVQIEPNLSYLNIEQEVDLWVYPIIREAESRIEIKLYGFNDKSLIDDFENLISISGVGPKMAFNIIKSMDRQSMIKAVEDADFKIFKKIPGVGDKLSKRLILELSRMYKTDNDVFNKLKQSGNINKVQSEVLLALTQMGFDKDSIIEIMNNIDSSLSKADMLREILLKLTNHV